MSRRSEQLQQSVNAFLKYHNDWVEDENRPNPDSEYWDLTEEMIDLFAEGSIPSDCRDLSDAIDKFEDEMEIFDQRLDVNEHYPQNSFWAAVESLQAIVARGARPNLPPLETLEVLRKQQVSDMQIAMIYGFKDRKGNFMPWLVQQELDKPGSVLKASGAIDGRDWKDPRISAEGPEEAEVSESPKLARKSQRAKEESQPCPESPRELFEQAVTAQQAAKMLRQPLDVVESMWRDFEAEDLQRKKDGEADKAQELVKSRKAKPVTTGLVNSDSL